MKRLLVVGLLVLASAARADEFWGTKEDTDERRARAQRDGDKYLLEARNMKRHGSPHEAREFALNALALYEKALGLPGTNDAELHYRAYVAARYNDDERAGWLKVVEHGDAFRAAKPLSPRIDGMLHESAMALSKLGAEGGAKADSYFTHAVEDYDELRRMIDHTNIDNLKMLSTIYSNEAEILMAVGRTEDAIAFYKTSIDYGEVDYFPLYKAGLAVAYDRDGQSENARRTMREALGDERDLGKVFQNISTRRSTTIFFVPSNDHHYYFALAADALGDKKAAIELYKRFLAEVASDRYKWRAIEHLEELGVKVKDTPAARKADDAD